MQPDSIKKLFINKYIALGEEKFYKFLITYSLNRVAESTSKNNNYNPALELLEYYDNFLKLYRKEGEEIYMELSKIFRKAAHKVYRISLKKGLFDKNKKFLNLVKNDGN